MPTLPNPEEFKRQSFRPDTGIVQANITAPYRALEGLGDTVVRTADLATDISNRIASQQANGALVELKRRQNLLTVGPDGYSNLRNGAATAPGTLQKYQDLHKQAVSEIGTKLSPQARAIFDAQAREAGIDYEAGFLTHAMREDIKHRDEVYNAQVAVSAETMGINYANPELLLRERQNLDKQVAQFVRQQGYTDPAIIERTLQEARGEGHEAVIRAYINDGNAGAAKQYFDGIRQEVTGAKAKTLDRLLKPAVSNQTGRNVAEEMFNMRLAGKTELDIQNYKIRATEGMDLDTIRIADMLYKDRVDAVEADNRQRKGSILLSYLNGEKGSGLSDPRLAEIEASDPLLAAQIKTQLKNAAERRAAGLSGTGKPSRFTDMATYAELTERIRSGEQLTAEDIVSYSASLKESDQKALIRALNSRDNAAGRAKISTTLINAGTPDSANNTERKNAYKGFVEQKLQEWKEANPGRIPTYDEQKAIVRSATEEHVEVGRFWNSTKEAYRAEGKRPTYPKRIEDMLPGYSEDQKLDAYSFIQGYNAQRAKGDRVYSDAELIKIWIEKYGQ